MQIKYSNFVLLKLSINNIMKSLAILIIEDDPIYVLDLEVKLKEMANHTIYVAESIAAAVQIYSNENIDLILLDLKLKDGEDGILFYEEFNRLHTPVIIITAYKDPLLFDATAAYEPVAYLVKPFDYFTLKSLIQSVIVSGLKQPSVFFIRHKGKLTKIPLDDICYFMSEGNHTYIFTLNKKYVIRKALSKVLHEVKSEIFHQVHRRYVVNIEKINSILLKENTLNICERSLPIGRIYKKELREKLNIV